MKISCNLSPERNKTTDVGKRYSEIMATSALIFLSLEEKSMKMNVKLKTIHWILLAFWLFDYFHFNILHNIIFIILICHICEFFKFFLFLTKRKQLTSVIVIEASILTKKGSNNKKIPKSFWFIFEIFE